MPRHWQLAFVRLAIFLLVVALLGWLVDAVLAALAIGLALAHLWLCVRLIRLERHIRAGRIDWNDDDDVVNRFGARFLRWRRAERTARRRLLRALRSFRDAATALPDAVLVVDDLDQVLWFNQSAQRLLLVRGPHDFGKPLAKLLPIRSMLEWYGAQPEAEPLMDVAAPADADLRLSFRVVRYRDRLRLLIVREITWLLRLEKMRRDFVANVSHELRTPLTVISGYLDAIDDSEMPDYAPILGQMRQQSARMTQIVDDLLLLSRLDAQERAPMDNVSMPRLLRELIEDANIVSSGDHQIVLDQSFNADLLGSEKLLRSAFSNLLINAVRYTPSGGLITMRFAADQAGNGAVLSVHDSGVGIPAEHLHRVTERFYRVSASRSRETGGTGLGLAIVKHVLQIHEAELRIESELGKGSIFHCHLPEHRLARSDPG